MGRSPALRGKAKHKERLERRRKLQEIRIEKKRGAGKKSLLKTSFPDLSRFCVCGGDSRGNRSLNLKRKKIGERTLNQKEK